MPSTVLAAALLGCLSSLAEGMALEPRINNGVGRTPAMGWNNYVGQSGSVAARD